jgi:hypothetical protein
MLSTYFYGLRRDFDFGMPLFILGFGLAKSFRIPQQAFCK